LALISGWAGKSFQLKSAGIARVGMGCGVGVLVGVCRVVSVVCAAGWSVGVSNGAVGVGSSKA